MPHSPYGYWLSEGDHGTATNEIDLNDGVTFGVHLGGFHAPKAKPGALRQVTVEFSAYGVSNDAILDQLNLIEIMLEQARIAAGPSGVGTPISLGVQLDTTTIVFYDVWDGTLTYDGDGLTYVQSQWVQTVTLTLSTEPFGRGKQVTATNRLRNSSAFTGSGWSATNLTPTDNAATAPNGATAAATLLETTDTGAHEIAQSVTKAGSALPYTVSYYVKAKGRSQITVILDDASTNGVTARFDLASATVASGAVAYGSGFTAGSAAIRADRQGYARVSLSLTSNDATTIRARLQLYNGGSSYAGDVTKGVFLWGAALQPADTLGPYLETNDSLTLINGASAFYLYDVPGSADALVNLKLADVSTNSHVLNTVQVYRRSLVGITPDDFGDTVKLSASGYGADTTDSSDYTGSAFARATAGSSYHEIASGLTPSGASGWSGMMDIIGRVRDHINGPSAPTMGDFTSSGAAIEQYVVGAPVIATSAVSATWNHATKDGSLLLCFVARIKSGTNSGMSISTPSGWTSVAASGTVIQAFDDGDASLFKIEGAPSQSGTVSTTANGGGTGTGGGGNGYAPGYVAMVLIEVSGVPSSGALVASAHATGSSSGTNACGSITYSDEYQLKLSMIAGQFTAASAESGDTLLFSQSSGTNGPWMAAQYAQTGASTGAMNPAFTTTGSGTLIWMGFHVQIASGALPSGTQYTFAASEVDASGNVSVVGNRQTATATYPSMSCTITPNALGTWDHFRVYWQHPGDANWTSIDMSAGETVFFFGAESGTSGVDLPTSPTLPFSIFRVRVSDAAGDVTISGDGISAEVGNSQWEELVLGTVSVPILASRDGGLPDQVYVAIDALNADSPGVNVDVDYVRMVPHTEPQCLGVYSKGGSDNGLAEQYTWEFDSNRWGISSSIRLLDDTGAVKSLVTPTGPYYIAPRESVNVLRMVGKGGISSVADLKATMELKLTPRYQTLAGSR